MAPPEVTNCADLDREIAPPEQSVPLAFIPRAGDRQAQMIPFDRIAAFFGKNLRHERT